MAYPPIIFWYLKAACLVVIVGALQQRRQRRRPFAGSACTLGAGPRPAHEFRVRVGRGGPVPPQFQRLPHPSPRGPMNHSTLSNPAPWSRETLRWQSDGDTGCPAPSGIPQPQPHRSVEPGPPLLDTPTRPQGPPPAQRSILGDRRGPARSLVASRRRGGRAGLAGAGKEGGGSPARGEGGALTRMFTLGHPGKWKRRALLRGGEPQTPGQGPPPPPPPPW